MANAFPDPGSISSPNVASLTNPNFSLINPANQINSVKIINMSYLLWNLQVLAGLRGLGRESFMSAHLSVPPHVIFVDGASEVVNPTFIIWCRQDQLLFSFLLASMSETVQAQMIGCESSVGLWTQVSTIFATRSKARVMHYKLKLQTFKKRDLNMKDYVIKMKGFMNLLAASGHPIFDEDQILYVLGGVGIEYDFVVVHITSKPESLTFSEVGALLMSHEGQLESHNLIGASPPKAMSSATENGQSNLSLPILLFITHRPWLRKI